MEGSDSFGLKTVILCMSVPLLCQVLALNMLRCSCLGSQSRFGNLHILMEARASTGMLLAVFRRQMKLNS